MAETVIALVRPDSFSEGLMKLLPATLATLSLLLAALPAAAADANKRDDTASEKLLGIKLSLQCWTFNRLTFFETVDKAKELGIRYLEMFPGQTLKPDSKEKVGRNMSAETIAEVKKKLADANIKLVAYGVDGVPTDEAGAARFSRGPRTWASRCS